MKRLFKLFFWLLLLLVIVVVGYWVYVNFIVEVKTTDAYKALPEKTFLAIRTNDAYKAYEEFTGSQLWNNLQNTQLLQPFKQDFDFINNLITATNLPENFFNQRTIIFALIPKNDNIYYLIITDLKKLSQFTKDFLASFKKLGDYKILKNKYTYKDQTFKYYKFANVIDYSDNYYIAVLDNLLIISNNRSVLKDAFKAYVNQYWIDNKQLQELIAKTAQNKLFKIFVNFNQLSDFYQIIQSSKDQYIDFLSQSLNYAIFDVDFANEELSLYGIVGYDTNALYFNAIAKTNPVQSTSFRIMPSDVAVFFTINFDSYQKFFNNLLKEYQKANPSEAQSIQKAFDYLDKIFGISVGDDIIAWFGNEIALYKLTPQYGKRLEDAIIAIHTNNPRFAQAKLKYLMKKIKKVTPFSFKQSEYKGFEIGYLKIDNFFKLFFGKLFENYQLPYFTMIENYILFSNNPHTLMKIIDNYQKDFTLEDFKEFNDFYNEFPQEKNISAFAIMPALYPTIYYFADYQQRKILEQYQDIIQNFSLLGLQLANNENQINIEVRIAYKPELKFSLLSDKIMREIEFETVINDIINQNILEINDSILNSADEQGKIEIADSLGNILISGQIENGQPVGLWIYYYDNGNIRKKVLIDNVSGKISIISYYYNDQANNKLADIFHTENLYKGTIYYPNAATKATLEFTEDFSLLKVEYYYPNGNLKAQGSFKNGKKDGKWIYYDQDENPIIIETWKQGKLKNSKLLKQ